MTHEAAPPGPALTRATPARTLLPLFLPSVVVGAVSALLYVGVSKLADQLKDVLWTDLPDALDIGGYSSLWMIVMLTTTGILVGLVVWKAPGHAGPDPATVGIQGEPMALFILPGLLVATALMLAGGPSLGPENPIIATNVALAFWAGRRFAPAAPGVLWVTLAEAGTIGALFGTPVAAALVISEALAGRQVKGLLWDNLFAPLTAASVGSITTSLIGHPSFDLDLPPLGDPGWADVLSALVIASAAAVLGMAAVYVFPYVHKVFSLLRHPMIALPVGGLVLGLLGCLGGPLTLFKGLEQVDEIARNPDAYSAGRYALMAVVKLAALVVATSCGFRGGRIFPAVFAGASFGLCAHALVSSVPASLGLAAGVLGVLLATTRQGWVSLFTAAVLVSSPTIIALLCIASLPAWLLVTGRPQLQLREDGSSVR
ncbi:ion channel protein [Streptomyces rhizosphaerihabitans]|uniref:ion channel protein n=1 Tax=Streptomyces rhizosphaerihabitans TaxID=1266770 RepID=UPI0021BFE731|nr:ion channel protein [Streptomyces rhizosphaerihabitans]MCT9006302.1 ion channel protein [Streptomyces rhizosphaerihabitans]